LRNISLLDHELIPKHEILATDELQTVLNHYQIDKEQLPKIKSTDPIIQEIGALEGDVVKISRKSQTAGEGLYYRLVIK
jgi:DNA-directed RNA polymerase subunit H